MNISLTMTAFWLLSIFASVGATVFLMKTFGKAKDSGGNTQEAIMTEATQLRAKTLELQEKIDQLRQHLTAAPTPSQSTGAPAAGNSVGTLVLRQRAFLHDVASPIAIAIGNIEILIRSAEKTTGADPQMVTRLQKAATALERVNKMLVENREFLMFAA